MLGTYFISEITTQTIYKLAKSIAQFESNTVNLEAQSICAMFIEGISFGLTRVSRNNCLIFLRLGLLLDYTFTRFEKFDWGLVNRFGHFTEITRSDYSTFYPSNGQVTQLRVNRVNFCH